PLRRGARGGAIGPRRSPPRGDRPWWAASRGLRRGRGRRRPPPLPPAPLSRLGSASVVPDPTPRRRRPRSPPWETQATRRDRAAQARVEANLSRASSTSAAETLSGGAKRDRKSTRLNSSHV